MRSIEWVRFSMWSYVLPIFTFWAIGSGIECGTEQRPMNREYYKVCKQEITITTSQHIGNWRCLDISFYTEGTKILYELGFFSLYNLECNRAEVAYRETLLLTPHTKLQLFG